MGKAYYYVSKDPIQKPLAQFASSKQELLEDESSKRERRMVIPIFRTNPVDKRHRLYVNRICTKNWDHHPSLSFACLVFQSFLFGRGKLSKGLLYRVFRDVVISFSHSPPFYQWAALLLCKGVWVQHLSCKPNSFRHHSQNLFLCIVFT